MALYRICNPSENAHVYERLSFGYEEFFSMLIKDSNQFTTYMVTSRRTNHLAIPHHDCYATSNRVHYTDQKETYKKSEKKP